MTILVFCAIIKGEGFLKWLLNFYKVVTNLGGQNFFNEILPIAVIVALTVATIIAVWKVSKEAKAKRYLATLMDSAEELYFCGSSLSKVIETKALFRFQKWADVGMCLWWAPLGMLLLKDNPTAELYQGTLYDIDGTQKFHAWVEFNIPQGERFVLDFSWLDSAFCEKKRFFKWLKREKVRLVPEWSCDYSTFWLQRWPNYLWELMQDRKTSHVLDGLSVLCPENNEEFGFKSLIEEFEIEDPEGYGVFMPPWIIEESGKIISTGILQDFIKYPKRQAPRDKTIKKAYRLLREVEESYVE